MARANQFPVYYHLILYACGFFLFLEWLYPLHVLGTTDYFIVFLLFTQFCFLISFLQLHWVIGSAIKAVAFIFVIQGLFFSTSVFSGEWILLIFEDIQLNMSYMFSREFHLLTESFRTLLFMALIWLMSYLIYYWFVSVKKVLIFSVCTFVYIAMLDTFTAYAGNWGIIRAFLIVALSFALANVMKDAERTHTINMFRKYHLKWIAPIVLFSVLTASIGIVAPKTAGEWQDPISHLTNYFKDDANKDGDLEVTRKVGYGENDEHLGGAFEFDDTPLFQVTSKEKRYWRVESKEIYTGKGWDVEKKDDEWTYSSGDVPFNMQGINVDYEQEESTVIFEENTEMNKIVYPYGAKKVETDESVDQYLVHLTNGTIQPTVNNQVTSIGSYTLMYNYPIYRAGDLRQVDGGSKDSIDESYTQVPTSLPDRVGELAEEITADYETQYDKVRAIEQYFSEAEFVYETDDVSVPSEGIDYVDEFLFDTQAGYCDNFSSSMAVMLRTQNIPTRWIKGFTGGTDVEASISEDENMYEITNANAHSWVEVYFAGIGWVPFEPTVGFTGAGEIDESPAEEEVEEAEELEPTEELEQEDAAEREEEIEQQEEEENIVSTQQDTKSKKIFLWIGLSIALLAVAGAILFWRHRMMMHLILLTLSKGPTDKAINRSMSFCLSMCSTKGLNKETGETLRAFSKRVDRAQGMSEMSKLTKIYEQYMYSKDEQIDLDAYKKTWKKVIQELLLDR